MVEQRISRGDAARPVPISFIIQTASMFGCDIYIRSSKTLVNAKNYDELRFGLSGQSKQLTLYFDGVDEREADVKFRRIFQTDEQ